VLGRGRHHGRILPTVIALSNIDDAVLPPATSKLGLDALIDRFDGFEIDEMRNVYRSNFVPFLGSIKEQNLDDVLLSIRRTRAWASRAQTFSTPT
jgi:hypothetical protein